MIINSTNINSKFNQAKRSFTAYAIARRSKPSEILWSFLIYFLALSCLILVFVTSSPNVIKTSFISPIVASIQSVFQKDTNAPLETFSFVPGAAPNKFKKVDFNGLNMLSYYDIAVNSDGTLNTDTDSYLSLYTPESNDLFHAARQNGTRVLLTFTMSYGPDIQALLTNKGSQQELFNAAAQEVQATGTDGVTIAFEYAGDIEDYYRTEFSTFVKDFTISMHNQVPNSIVSIAIPDDANDTGMYDIKTLSENADNTFLMAYTFAVPEMENAQIKAPVFGFNDKAYLANVTSKQNAFLQTVPHEKLLMERAWYGNGNQYPLYSMDALNEHRNDPSQNTLKTPLSDAAIERLITDVPDEAKASARKNVPYIAKALEDEGILNANVLAYALATIQHETANTFEPIDEFKGRKSARRLGYEGGTHYFGRGFIQLTHLRNYQKIGERIGVGEKLVKHPEIASQPEIAAKVLAAYFKDFGIAKQAADGNFIAARTLINPDYNGETIAAIALGFLYALA